MWLQGAERKNIPPGSNDPHIIPVGAVLHVEGSGIPHSLHDIFLSRDGIETHLYVRYDGTMEQYRDTVYEADAQASGNSWLNSAGHRVGMISIETQGKCGSGEYWRDAQLSTIKDILTQLRAAHDIPWNVATSEHSGGIGFHAQFPGWNPNNHACPCPTRIEQFHREIPNFLSKHHSETNPRVTRSSDVVIYVTEDGGAYAPTANPAILTRIAGGPAETGDGNYHDYVNNGVPAIPVSKHELNRRGFQLIGTTEQVRVK
jgi:hypothetical protein